MGTRVAAHFGASQGKLFGMPDGSSNRYGLIIPVIVAFAALAIALVAILAHLPALAGGIAAGIVAAFFFVFLPFRRGSERAEEGERSNGA